MTIKHVGLAREFFYSWLGYQFFITPFRFRPPVDYYPFMHKAQEWFYGARKEKIIKSTPKHYVVHRFSPQIKSNGKRVLVVHGWMSCATWMTKYINAFTLKGYEVYALDFPAHGEAKGLQVTWLEALAVLQLTIEDFGPFDIALGHSFGGSMLINAVNLHGQLPECKLGSLPSTVITLGSPTKMRLPIYHLARRFQMSGTAYKELARTIMAKGSIGLDRLQLRYLANRSSNVQWICVHGKQDEIVAPSEAVVFCDRVPNSQLILVDGVDHVSLLIDDKASREIFKKL